jgi:hypothetical protein
MASATQHVEPTIGSITLIPSLLAQYAVHFIDQFKSLILIVDIDHYNTSSYLRNAFKEMLAEIGKQETSQRYQCTLIPAFNPRVAQTRVQHRLFVTLSFVSSPAFLFTPPDPPFRLELRLIGGVGACAVKSPWAAWA